MVSLTALGRWRRAGACALILLAALALVFSGMPAQAQPARRPASSGALTLPLPVAAAYDLSLAPQGQALALPEMALNIQPGQPRLPVTTLSVLLPPDAIAESVSIELIEPSWADLPGVYEIAAAPPLAANDLAGAIEWGGHAPEAMRQGRLMAIYDNDAYWPAEPLVLLTVGSQRNWQVLTVAYWPLAYNPVRGAVRQLTGGSLRVSFQRSSEPLPALDAASHAAWQALALSLVNPEAQTQYLERPDVIKPASDAPGAASSQSDYVIITTSQIAANSAQLTTFVQAKERAGFRIRVVTEGPSATGVTYVSGGSADQRANNIRHWLASRYAADGIRHVLLIGNPHPTSFDTSTSVPMKMTHPFAETPTDMYYSDLTGNWDRNGNGRFGELGDLGSGGIDRLPEVTVGRLPFYGSYQDLDLILHKLAAYQSATGDLSWRQRALIAPAISNHGPQDNNNDGIIGAPMDFPREWRTFGDDWGQAVRNLVLGAGLGAYTLYEREGVYADGSAFPLTQANAALTMGNLLSAWQQGYGIVAWWAHGNDTGSYRRIWAHDNTRPDRITQHAQETSNPLLFSSAETPHLHNSRPAFVLQVSCLNGYPEAAENLGYRLLVNGAVGTVSASRLSYYAVGAWPPGGFTNWGDNAAMAHSVMNRMLNHGETIGQALAHYRGHADVLQIGALWQNMLTLNLYGDPSLSLTSRGVVCAEPSAVVPVAPQDGAQVAGGQTVELRWQDAEGASVYEVQVAADPSFSAIIAHWQTEQLVLTTTAPLQGGTSYWRVRGVQRQFGCHVNGAWSETYSYQSTLAALPFSVFMPISSRR